MRASSHFWLLGSEVLNLGLPRNGDSSVHTGRSTSSATPLARETFTNVQGRVVSGRSGNPNQGKRGDSLASQEALPYKRLVVLAALTVRTGSQQIINEFLQCHFGPAHVYKEGIRYFTSYHYILGSKSAGNVHGEIHLPS